MLCNRLPQGITDSTAQAPERPDEKGQLCAVPPGFVGYRQEGKQGSGKARLGVVVQNIERTRNHSSPTNQDDPTRVNATCDGCHDTHSFGVPQDSQKRAAWRLAIPKTCGENCHANNWEKRSRNRHTARRSWINAIRSGGLHDCHTSHALPAIG